ncbi:halocyanin domain-containing protein [Halobacteriales archaeon QH_10_65_19]|nr:MAG: halocyanin domain-containing protein [Halobacteriales archaeon QH_10_65_19]
MNRIDRGRRTLLQAGSATLAATVTGCVGGSDGGDSAGSGQESATVSNGANAPDYAFDPAAIRVDGGTEVTWEWLNAVAHSVTHRDGEFDSGLRGEKNSTFSHIFDGAGTYLYYCVPHKSIGQNGAVIVE